MNMDIKVTHFVDNERHLVINASGPSFSYGAVLLPNFKDGIPHIKIEDIDTKGIDDSKKVQTAILQAISTQRGKYNEESVKVDDYNPMNVRSASSTI
jgi:hypothetical protein